MSTLHERIARVCHEANRAWSVAHGDLSHHPWDAAPDWQRQSAIAGVKVALSGATPEQLHESWTAAKVADGWTYGPVKDETAKTHPCLLPYAQLPSEQRRKDALFAAVTTALGCGQERWDVKTGTDPDAGRVNLQPLPSTIADLVALPAPPPDPPARVAPAEFQVYTLTATITEAKQEADSDYHLALSDGQGNTMIAEAACPGCASGSPWLTQIQAVRAAVDTAIPGLTGQYQPVNRTATITGPASFDRIHGQAGVAPNGIEIHPCLAIEFH